MTQTTPDAPVRRQRAQIRVRTLRNDRWWLAPLLTFLALSAFLVYGVWAIIDGSYYFDPYIAPFSSPCLIPWSLACLPCGGGASDAAVAAVSASSIRITRPR